MIPFYIKKKLLKAEGVQSFKNHALFPHKESPNKVLLNSLGAIGVHKMGSLAKVNGFQFKQWYTCLVSYAASLYVILFLHHLSIHSLCNEQTCHTSLTRREPFFEPQNNVWAHIYMCVCVCVCARQSFSIVIWLQARLMNWNLIPSKSKRFSHT